jgi:hypothetical protein
MKGEKNRGNMNSIKFNQATKEIEIKGSESFIESNFDMIEDLLAESLGVIKTKRSVTTISDEKPILWVETIDPHATEAITIPDVIETPEIAPAAQQNILEVSQEPKVKRPPARKYFNTLGKLIRSEDTSINKEQVSDPIRQISHGISITSLKENFGLSEQQIDVIIRDAEKQGRARRDLDGSYIWE